MLFRDSPEQAAFRQEIRTFLDAELPADVWNMRNDREEMDEEEAAFTSQFRAQLAARGWLTLGWPTEYGGGGADFVTQTIYMEEMSSRGAPRRLRPGGLAGWAGAHARGDEGAAAGPLVAGPARGHLALVPALFRAGRGLRPGVAADERHPRRATNTS